MLDDWSIWQWLTGADGAALMAAVQACEDFHEVAAVSRLRRLGDAEQVRLAIGLYQVRCKAGKKFPRPQQLVADPLGLEQASDLVVAQHKARRFAEAGLQRVVDMCCGIGGDAMALSEVAEVLAMDLSPARAWMARANVRSQVGRDCHAVVGDVKRLACGRPGFHLDPDRRSGGRRRWRYADYRPEPGFIGSLMCLYEGGAVKLGPGVDYRQLPTDSCEVELISHRRHVVQAVLWSGVLKKAERSATNLDAGFTVSGRVEPLLPGDRSAYLHVPDPVVERAELVGHLQRQADAGLGEVHPGLGLLGAGEPYLADWLKCYRVLERLPFRSKHIKRALRSYDVGEVIVKTRGRACDDPDTLAKQWRGGGSQVMVVFVLRLGRRIEAWLTRPMGSPGRGESNHAPTCR